VVVPGCRMRKKRIATMPRFLDHLASDVILALPKSVTTAAEVGEP
jgi:hypothetical protein